jgi:hypothetical protein
MQQDILINWSPQETRVAIMENGVLQELHVERTLERGLVGNVYLGKVAGYCRACSQRSSTLGWSVRRFCMWPMSGTASRTAKPRSARQMPHPNSH